MNPFLEHKEIIIRSRLIYIDDLDEKISFINELRKINNPKKHVKDFINITEFIVFTLQNILDLSSCMLIYLSPVDKYQETYALKNIIIHLNEGFKRLIHFNPRGSKDSLLHTLLKDLAYQEEDTKFKFDSLIEELDKYCEEYQTIDFKSKRSCFVHYEGVPSNLHFHQNSIDFEILVINYNRYSELFNIIFELTTILLSTYTNKIIKT